MILPFKLHQDEITIVPKTLVSNDPQGLLMYRFDAPETINILGQFPDRIFLYYHQGRLVTVFVRLKPQENEKTLFRQLEEGISDALQFLPETLPSTTSAGLKWETDVEVLVLLHSSENSSVSLYLADKKHSVF